MKNFKELIKTSCQALEEEVTQEILELLIECSGFLDEPGRTITINRWLKFILKKTTNQEIAHLLVEFLSFSDKESERYLRKKLKFYIVKGDVAQIRFLLNYGANLCDLQRRDWPLTNHVFSKSNCAELFTMFIDYDFDFDMRNNQDENLVPQFFRYHYKKCDVDAVQVTELLLYCDVSVDEPDNLGKTPLHYAITNADFELLKFLIKEGNVEVNEQPFPLNLAISYDQFDFVKFLLLNAADVNNKDTDGWTALHEACRYHNENIINLLLRFGADVSAETESCDAPFTQLVSAVDSYDECV